MMTTSAASTSTNVPLTDYERGKLDSYKERKAVLDGQIAVIQNKMNELQGEISRLEGAMRAAHKLDPSCTFDGNIFTCPPLPKGKK